MAKTLFSLNDSPYGTERSYDAPCAKAGQNVPQGFYNVELMVRKVARTSAQIGVCGTCMDARGIKDGELIEGTHRSTLAELSSWTQWADKVIAF